MSLAILCPGQGGQHASMFDLVRAESDAAPLIAQALEPARFDVVEATAHGASMFANAVAQPLICAYQGIVWSLLEPRLMAAGVAPTVCAGYSVGELAAHGCAGTLRWADTVALARHRAATMDAASGPDDGMVAVRGLTRPTLHALLAGQRGYVAIVNADDQFIVGGVGEVLDALVGAAAAHGGTAQRLSVAVAAHTPLLRDAVHAFRAVLQRTTWRTTPVAVLAGLDGAVVRDRDAAIATLSRQVAETIRWDACMDSLVERGVTTCLELGPGNALSRMMRDRCPDVEARSVADFRRIDAVVDWVARTAA